MSHLQHLLCSSRSLVSPLAALVNGLSCKDAQMVAAGDFFFSGLDKPGNTWNAVGSKATPVSVAQIPGLSTLGISLVRIDYQGS